MYEQRGLEPQLKETTVGKWIVWLLFVILTVVVVLVSEDAYVAAKRKWFPNWGTAR